MKDKIIAMRIEKDEYNKVEILRKKYFINISELFRKKIRDTYDELQIQNKDKNI
jgi:hypothetical protein